MSVIFYGAGRNCKNIIDIWECLGKKPQYIVDGNSEKWGTEIKGIPIFSPDKLKEIDKGDMVYVTCSKDRQIENRLRGLGIEKAQIVYCEGPGIAASEYVNAYVPSDHKIIFDLENGLTLGGVESWAFQEAKKLRELGWTTVFAVPGGKTTLAEEQQPFACEIYGADERNYVRKINAVSQYLLRSDAEYVVSDFGGTFFFGACIAKKSCPGKMKHIVVIHSDADSMYDRYAAMQEYIDKCIVISRKMITELQKRNFSTDKIYYLNWDIKCEEKLGRAYAPKGMPLRIGYAGRLTVHIKRLDLCVEVARELKRRGVPFLFQLAGVGDYSEQMKAEIQKAHLCEEMELLGYIERQDIDTFWQKQDIMISCSEHEGHSISQMEAMAAGAVPIVMDVSGAQDDITDSENGFIVEQGDICEMVNKICSLNEDRMLLQTMGSKAHESIYLKMQESKGNRLWL